MPVTSENRLHIQSTNPCLCNCSNRILNNMCKRSCLRYGAIMLGKGKQKYAHGRLQRQLCSYLIFANILPLFSFYYLGLSFHYQLSCECRALVGSLPKSLSTFTRRSFCKEVTLLKQIVFFQRQKYEKHLCKYYAADA